MEVLPKSPREVGHKEIAPKEPKEEKENFIDRAIDWVKGTFWGGPKQATEVDVNLPETLLENRELEEGKLKELKEEEPRVFGAEEELEGSKEPGFFKKIYGTLFGEGEAEVEEERKELNEDQKNIRAVILKSIRNKEGILAKFIEENSHNIVSNVDKFFDEKVVMQEAQALDELPSFEDAVIGGSDSESAKKFNFILEVLENEIQSGKFPDFDKTEFNIELFKKDPLVFMLKALSDNKERTDLFFIINYLANENPEFKEAFVEMKHKTENYFFELRKAKRDPQDTEYQKANTIYDQLEALQEAINHCDVSNDEREELEAEFQESFGKQFGELESFLVEKEKQEFEKLFQELAHTLLVNDKDYQKARLVIDNRVYQAGDTFDFAQMYFKDSEFRDAYNLVNARFKGMESLLGLNWHKQSESLMSVGDVVGGLVSDTAQFVADNQGRLLLSPALVLGTVVFGVQVIPMAVGLSIVKRALPAMQKILVESDLLFDNTGAREDQKIRAPFMQHIFLEAPTGEQRKRALDNILEARLLFKEDVDADPELQKYLNEQKIDLGTLPSISNYREKRLEFRMLMQADFPPEELLRDFTEVLHGDGLLYQEDFEGWSDEEINNVLPQGVKKENLPTLVDEKNIRNSSLFLIKGGVTLTLEQKLGEVLKLHEKGILFKEDIVRLQEGKVATDLEIIGAFLKEKNIALDELPSLQTHYYKTNVSLKQQDDRKREPFLAILKDGSKSQADKLLALKKMHLEGVSFLDDLELEGLTGKTVADFKQFVSISSADRKKMHDEAKTGAAILSKHEAVLKSIVASPEEKMASLLELEMEGLLSKQHKKMVDQPTIIRYNAMFLGKPEAMSNKLENSFEHYQSGVYSRLVKLRGIAYEGLKKNPGKIAGGLAFVAGGGWMAIGAAAFAGDIAGVIWRKERAVEIFNGPMKEVKNGIELGIGAVAGVVSDFTDIPAKNIHDRIVKQLPSDHKIKQGAAWMLNKGVGIVKTATLGAAIGSIFGTSAMKMGALLGGYFGTMVTDGKVSQVPAGGFERALKFSKVGALVGAVVPVVVAALAVGLGLAGLISSTIAISVSTCGLGLIIPLILFGIYAGFQIAGLTGKDEKDKTDPVMDNLLAYEPFSLEKAGVYLV